MYSQPSKFLSIAGLLLAAMIGSPAGAANFTVSSLNDSGAGSLRGAIDDANNAAGADTITFTVSGTISLLTTLPHIVDGSEITIDGTGQSITVSGDNDGDGFGEVRVMMVDAQATLKLKHLTIADGQAGSPLFFGGGIHNVGTLTVTDCTISHNSAGDDGGISNFGTLTVTDSTIANNHSFEFAGIGNGGRLTVTGSSFSGNSAISHGGGIGNGGILTVIGSSFSGNSAVDGGGGIDNGGTLTVTDSTFSGNGADRGGGIENFGTPLTVSNSTFSGNGATRGGGIIGGGIVTNSTFSGNTAEEGGGIDVTGSLSLANTILAGNIGGDCFNAGGTINPSGVNLVEDGSCDPNAITGDPMLDDLVDNGGPTLTHALLAGSPAIDAVTDDSCPPPATDQRGVARPQGAHCDIGAYEVQNSVDACTTAEVLDNFNRHDGPLGRNWRGQSDTRFYRIHDDQVDVRLGGPVFWNPDRFGANQAAFVTLSNVDTRGPAQGALLKVQDGRGPHTGRKDHEDGDGHEDGKEHAKGKDHNDGKQHEDDMSFNGAIAVTYDGRAQAVRVSTNRGGKRDRGWHSYGKTQVTFSDGDKLGACALATGEVRVYKNDVLLTTVKLDKADQAFFNDKDGKVGLWSRFAPRAVLDDFGGGTVTP